MLKKKQQKKPLYEWGDQMSFALCLKLIKIMCVKWIYAIYEKFLKSGRSHPISKKKNANKSNEKEHKLYSVFFIYNECFAQVLHRDMGLHGQQTNLLVGWSPPRFQRHTCLMVHFKLACGSKYDWLHLPSLEWDGWMNRRSEGYFLRRNLLKYWK